MKTRAEIRNLECIKPRGFKKGKDNEKLRIMKNEKE